MFVHITMGRRFNATASGEVLKKVQCERCGNGYVYQMRRSLAGSGFSLFFLDDDGARDRAKRRADAKLNKALVRSQNPVRCPTCGHLQRDMVRALARGRLSVVFVLYFFFIIAAFLIWVFANGAPLGHGLSIAWLPYVIIGGTALAILVAARRWLYDYNSDSNFGQSSRAVTTEEFEAGHTDKLTLPEYHSGKWLSVRRSLMHYPNACCGCAASPVGRVLPSRIGKLPFCGRCANKIIARRVLLVFVVVVVAFAGAGFLFRGPKPEDWLGASFGVGVLALMVTGIFSFALYLPVGIRKLNRLADTVEVQFRNDAFAELFLTEMLRSQSESAVVAAQNSDQSLS
jgi:hypothetical protein